MRVDRLIEILQSYTDKQHYEAEIMCLVDGHNIDEEIEMVYPNNASEVVYLYDLEMCRQSFPNSEARH